MSNSDEAKNGKEKTNESGLHFRFLENAEEITEILRSRLPKSANAIQKLLRKNKSVGLFKSGEILCGMLNNDCGLMGMLHTVKEQRGKGYATLVAKQLMKSLAVESGAVPCSAVELRNHQSIAFHEKLGMTCSHYADFIKYVPQNWS